MKEQFGLTQLPQELESLYRQTNGVDDYMYIAGINEWIQTSNFIWSVERGIETNTYNRTSDTYKGYKSFDNLFFFADSGVGDHFGFETVNGTFERSDVYFGIMKATGENG